MIRLACATALILATSTAPTLSRSQIAGFKCHAYQVLDRNDPSKTRDFMIKGKYSVPRQTSVGDLLIATTNPPDQATFGSPEHPLHIPERDSKFGWNDPEAGFELHSTPHPPAPHVVIYLHNVHTKANQMAVDVGDDSRLFFDPECRFQDDGFDENDWSWPSR